MHSFCLAGLAFCLLLADQTPANEHAPNLDQARADFAAGKVARARAVAEALHAADPNDVPAAVLLANCYIKMGRDADAVSVLKPLEAGHQSDMDLEYSLAFALLQSGSTEGMNRMEKVAEETRSAKAWTAVGAARLQAEDFTKAKEDLDRALKIDSSVAGLNTMSGIVRFALEDPDGAFPFFQAALRANPRDFDANLYDGICRLQKGDYEGARPMLDLALQLRPESPLARLKMAQLNVATGRYAVALAALQKLAEETPTWLDPHVQLATLYYKLGRARDGQRERDIVKQLQDAQQKAGPSKHNAK